jgi:hypothetical protein
LNGVPLTTQEQRDIICWYDGSPNFVMHLWKLLGYSIEADLTILDPIPYDPSMNRRQLADLSYQQILAAYQT